MTTAFLIIFSLLIEYIYDPISNMKDTHAMQSLIEKYKEYFKEYFNNKYVLYLFFAVLIFILINIILLLVDLILHPFQFLCGLLKNLHRHNRRGRGHPDLKLTILMKCFPCRVFSSN